MFVMSVIFLLSLMSVEMCMVFTSWRIYGIRQVLDGLMSVMFLISLITVASLMSNMSW